MASSTYHDGLQVTDRRSFLSALSTFAGTAIVSGSRGATPDTPIVDAESTIFYSHPDGSKNLVRFQIQNIDVPAGRLRVYNGSRKLLGTAGVLRTGNVLLGELWLEVNRPTGIVSELEAPGLRRPLRTTHRLVPNRRWTLNLLIAVDAASILQEIETLSPIRRAVQAVTYRRANVTVNPLPTSLDLDHMDHLPFLRMAVPAMEIERRFGIPVSSVTIVPDGWRLSQTSAMALSGSGVRILALEQRGGEPSQIWNVPGGGKLLVVTVPWNGTPGDLKFGASYDEMRGAVEKWLTTSPLLLSPTYDSDIAYLLGTVAEEAVTKIPAAVAAWNARVAYPKLVIGDTAELRERVERRASAVPVPKLEPRSADDLTPAQLASIATLRVAARTDRANNMMAVLGGIAGITSRIPVVIPGTLVFNSAPYARSGLVRMTDGTDQIATDVPALGYAYFLDSEDGGNRWRTNDRGSTLEGNRLSVRVDETTGALASLINKSDGRELVLDGSPGLNELEGSQLERISRQRLPGVASRLELRRWSPNLGSFITTVTVYDDLPWLDIENQAQGVGSQAMEYRFAFSLGEPQVTWETPAGYDESAAPLDRIEHLRWIQLSDDNTHVLFRGMTAPIASVTRGGILTSYAPRGLSRYRLQLASPFSPADTPWVFGWEAEPFATARIVENRAGNLPTYGSIFSVDQVGTAVLGLKPADDDRGVILYIQELLGVDREISIGSEILSFTSIRMVDFLERDLAELSPPTAGVARVPIPANGIVAVRLLGVEQP